MECPLSKENNHKPCIGFQWILHDLSVKCTLESAVMVVYASVDKYFYLSEIQNIDKKIFISKVFKSRFTLRCRAQTHIEPQIPIEIHIERRRLYGKL